MLRSIDVHVDRQVIREDSDVDLSVVAFGSALAVAYTTYEHECQQHRESPVEHFLRVCMSVSDDAVFT